MMKIFRLSNSKKEEEKLGWLLHEREICENSSWIVIHFKFDNLFNENKFAAKNWFLSILTPSSFHFQLLSFSSNPTKWIISTLPQRTHYTQLLCISISLCRYSTALYLYPYNFCLYNIHNVKYTRDLRGGMKWCVGIEEIWWMEQHYHFRWDFIYFKFLY